MTATTSIEVHADEFARGARYDFAVTVADGPHPDWLERAIAEGVRQLRHYPDETAASAAAARLHGRESSEVVVLNGAAEAFTLLARALRPRMPVIVHPSFTEPERALRDAELAPRRLVLAPPFALEPDGVPDEADLVIIGNPTNPTGVLHPAAALRGQCRPGRTTVIDEAFMDFVPGQPESLAAERELPGLVVVRSLTKILGLPGVRAGYLLASAGLAEKLRRARPQWPVNSLALTVIEHAADHQDYIEQLALLTAERRARLASALERISGVRTHPASANFVLLALPDAFSVHGRLRAEHSISTRPGWTFPGLDSRHLRVAVRGAPLDGRLVQALAEVAGGS